MVKKPIIVNQLAVAGNMHWIICNMVFYKKLTLDITEVDIISYLCADVHGFRL